MTTKIPPPKFEDGFWWWYDPANQNWFIGPAPTTDLLIRIRRMVDPIIIQERTALLKYFSETSNPTYAAYEAQSSSPRPKIEYELIEFHWYSLQRLKKITNQG